MNAKPEKSKKSKIADKRNDSGMKRSACFNKEGLRIISHVHFIQRDKSSKVRNEKTKFSTVTTLRKTLQYS